MLQTISKFKKLPLAAFVLVSAATFNSPKVEAISSQNLTQQPLSNIIAAAPEWKEFHSDEGKFSLLMPGEKISDTKPDKSEMHEGVESEKMYMSIHEKNVYMVGFADFKNDVSQVSSSELLDSAVQAMLNDGEKLLSQKTVTLGAYQGREIKLQDEKKGMTLTSRIFIVNQRLYILLVASNENPQVSDVRKFFDSFQLMQ